MAITSLRLIPFRFDTECRKVLDSINSSINVKACLDKIGLMMAGKGNRVIQQNLISMTKQVSSEDGSSRKRESSVNSRGK